MLEGVTIEQLRINENEICTAKGGAAGICRAGVCTPVVLNCNDNNPCTIDARLRPAPAPTPRATRAWPAPTPTPAGDKKIFGAATATATG